MSTEIDSIRMLRATAEAQLEVSTEILGDILGEHYGIDGDGMDAIVFHLVKEHHWLPSEIRNMDRDDLRLVLSSEFDEHSEELGQRLRLAEKAKKAR